MIAIKHRYTDTTLCEFDVETVKQATEKGKADLRGADLDGEKLTKSPLVITGLRYWCLISDGYMRLGCKRFTHEEWAEFSDDEIEKMDSCALEFWKQWKESLLAMCKAHAVKPVEEK